MIWESLLGSDRRQRTRWEKRDKSKMKMMYDAYSMTGDKKAVGREELQEDTLCQVDYCSKGLRWCSLGGDTVEGLHCYLADSGSSRRHWSWLLRTRREVARAVRADTRYSSRYSVYCRCATFERVEDAETMQYYAAFDKYNKEEICTVYVCIRRWTFATYPWHNRKRKRNHKEKKGHLRNYDVTPIQAPTPYSPYSLPLGPTDIPTRPIYAKKDQRRRENRVPEEDHTADREEHCSLPETLQWTN